ncbi:MAG: hypothetical protein SFT92_04075 [Rickettsiales bacterium]|nr:hypothetical protein [Rickettsiales bacterium]
MGQNNTDNQYEEKPRGLLYASFVFLLIVVFVLPLNLSYAADTSEVMLQRQDGNKTPVRLYGDWSSCLPTIILSHGMGGDDSGLAYIGNAAAKKAIALR